MERFRWLIIIEPGDFRVESLADYQLVMQELSLAAQEETQRLGQRVLAVFKTLA